MNRSVLEPRNSAARLPENGKIVSLETELQIPLFSHECFSGNSTAHNDVSQKPLNEQASKWQRERLGEPEHANWKLREERKEAALFSTSQNHSGHDNTGFNAVIRKDLVSLV